MVNWLFIYTKLKRKQKGLRKIQLSKFYELSFKHSTDIFTLDISCPVQGITYTYFSIWMTIILMQLNIINNVPSSDEYDISLFLLIRMSLACIGDVVLLLSHRTVHNKLQGSNLCLNTLYFKCTSIFNPLMRNKQT